MCFYVVTFHFYVKIHEKVKHFYENVLHSSIEVCTSDISDFTLSLKWGEKIKWGQTSFDTGPFRHGVHCSQKYVVVTKFMYGDQE